MTKDELELYLYRWRYGPDSELTAHDVANYVWDLLYPLVPRPEASNYYSEIVQKWQEVDAFGEDEQRPYFEWVCLDCGESFQNLSKEGLAEYIKTHESYCFENN